MSLKRLCGGALLLFSICCGKGAVIEGPRDKIYYPNQGPVELTCNISEGSTGWRVNGSDRVFTITNLREGELAGHNVSGANSLLVINATNNTQYRCVSIRDAGDVDSDPVFLYIAGPPSMVGDIVIDVDTVIVNTGVNFTVNWDEPFANFDPIVNYTITINCSDASCPVMFTVAATSASVNFITDLSMITPLSVTASNTVGTSDPTTIMIAVPGNVGMINLVCIPVDLINQCTVTWNPLAVDTTLPIAYNVSYDVIANDAMSGFVLTNTSMASFDIPPVNGNVNAIVAALNALGLGPASNVAMAEIMSSSVAEIQLVATPEDATNSTYSITVNCTINPASTADMCEVMASANDQTLTGTASVANGMATVTIDGLACETMYTITAGGTLNRVLVGPRLSRGPITTGPCPPVITPTLASTTSTSVMIVTTPIPTETSGGGTAIGTTCSISFVALATLTAMVM